MQIRNKLNEQQSAKITSHRQILDARRQEVAKMDARIAELKLRVRKKKQLQLQPQQPPAALNTRPAVNQLFGSSNNNNSKSAVVEPYYIKPQQRDVGTDVIKAQLTSQGGGGATMSKQDSKYQSLPFNTKFPGNNAQRGAQQVATSSPGFISTGPPPPQPFTSPPPPKQFSDPPTSTTDASNKTGVTSSSARLMHNFAPQPYGSHLSHGAQVSVPSVTSRPPQSVARVAASPKTSTPIAPMTAKEIFITGAPQAATSLSGDRPAPPSAGKFFTQVHSQCLLTNIMYSSMCLVQVSHPLQLEPRTSLRTPPPSDSHLHHLQPPPTLTSSRQVRLFEMETRRSSSNRSPRHRRRRQSRSRT